jgi:transposase
MVAAYLRSQHPNCRLVKAKGQKVAALRRYLRSSAKSDRIDALTLAKMPFIDPERLDELYLPPAETHALLCLTRQRKRLEDHITARKNRITTIVDGYLTGVHQAFSHRWSAQARTFLHSRINPFAVVRDGEEALAASLVKRSHNIRRKGRRVILSTGRARTCYLWWNYAKQPGRLSRTYSSTFKTR